MQNFLENFDDDVFNVMNNMSLKVPFIYTINNNNTCCAPENISHMTKNQLLDLGKSILEFVFHTFPESFTQYTNYFEFDHNTHTWKNVEGLGEIWGTVIQPHLHAYYIHSGSNTSYTTLSIEG